jgi:hypothetical protein
VPEERFERSLEGGNKKMQFQCSRRHFLKLAAGTTAGLATARITYVLGGPHVPRVGLIGLGDRGLRHLDFAAKTGAIQLTDICDSSETVLLQAADGLDRNIRSWTNYRNLLTGGSYEILLVCLPHFRQSEVLELASSMAIPVYLDPATPHEMPSHRDFVSPAMIGLHLGNRIASTTRQAVAHARGTEGTIVMTSRQDKHQLLPSFDAVDLLAQMLPPAPLWRGLRVSRLIHPWGSDYELSIDRKSATTHAYLKTTSFQLDRLGTEVQLYSKEGRLHTRLPARGSIAEQKLHRELWARFSAAVRAGDPRMLAVPLRSVGLSTLIMSGLLQASKPSRVFEWAFC